MLWMMMLGLIPIGCGLILLLVKPLLSDQGVDLLTFFPQINFFLFLHFLLPLMTIFIGTAIIGDEVEERTLPYLITRPISKTTIVLSKTAAGGIAVASILTVSLILTYTLMVMDGGFGGWFSNISILLQGIGVMVLGLLVYIPLFGIFGGLLKRPVLAGLLFAFGWENSVSFFPGNVKLMTVAHYLHTIAPPLKQIKMEGLKTKLFSLILPAKEISPVVVIVILLGLSVLFLGILVSILYLKEYRLEQN